MDAPAGLRENVARRDCRRQSAERGAFSAPVILNEVKNLGADSAVNHDRDTSLRSV